MRKISKPPLPLGIYSFQKIISTNDSRRNSIPPFEIVFQIKYWLGQMRRREASA